MKLPSWNCLTPLLWFLKSINASLSLLADGRRYYLSRRGGGFVLPAEPKFELPAQNQLEIQRDVNACPTISNNRLFLRINGLHCYIGEKQNLQTR